MKVESNNNIFHLDFQQSPFNTNNGQRLSPQQQLSQQLLASFQNTNGSGNNPQLSPRQPAFGQQSQAQSTVTQQWTQQQGNNVRLTLQQSNPMLNAQLSVSGEE